MKGNKLLVVLGSICLVLIMAVLPFIAACAKPAPPSPPAPAPPSLAEFEISSLVVIPGEAEIGQRPTISVDVTNIGRVEGTYSITLTVDGGEVETRDVAIAPGVTETVTFTLAQAVAVIRIELAESTGVLIAKSPQRLPCGYILSKKKLYEGSKLEIFNKIEIFDITYMSDGLKVKGLLAQPKTPGIYPAIIFNRGGNRNFGLLIPQQLVSYALRGYVVVGSQYRGSCGGEGQEEFGGADINDVLNLIPLLKNMPNVDADRIGMIGVSRGGMMTYIALKEQTLRGTDDIKVAVVINGIADLFMAAEERPGLVDWVLAPLIGGTPNQVPEEYEARSATYWADKINVPLLIQHGEVDKKVSVDQARKLAKELDKYGKVYKLIVYPGYGHALGDPRAFSDRFAWLDHYLK